MPEVAGCYSDTGSTNENEIYYSETGTTDAQQNIVGAFDLGETGAPDVSASQPHRRSSRAPYHATRAGVSWQCPVLDWLLKSRKGRSIRGYTVRLFSLLNSRRGKDTAWIDGVRLFVLEHVHKTYLVREMPRTV